MNGRFVSEAGSATCRSGNTPRDKQRRVGYMSAMILSARSYFGWYFSYPTSPAEVGLRSI